jgi:cytosine/adenosine deaminase-related metal-dependent hydrolase
MEHVAGPILTDEGFIEGYVSFEDGVIIDVGEGSPDGPAIRGIVVPTFVNAHTHIADFIVPVDLEMSLEEVVAPPHGLKHFILENAPLEVQRASMRSLSRFMFHRGISSFVDFREGGVQGSSIMANISDGAKPVVLGRPVGLEFDQEEIERILQVADGIAVSSISDWDAGELSAMADMTHRHGKTFALHASERVREDMDLILDLHPTFLVHMTMATDHDLQLCASGGIPVVVCPRSNMFFGAMPPLARMVENEVLIALGSDNAMISMPDILTEMEFAGRILRCQGHADLRPVIDMAITNGRKILIANEEIGIEPDRTCDFVVIRSRDGDAVTDLVLRSAVEDPVLVCHGTQVWRGPQ